MRKIAFFTLAACLACNGHLDTFELDGGARDTGYAVDIVPADILFVVDNSGSMADEQENLAINFDSFVDQTAGFADYQIAVVTTDLSSAMSERTGYQSFVYDSDYPNVLVDFSTSACLSIDVAHGCFRGPDADRRIITSALTREEQIQAFGENVRVGSCGSGNEMGLGAMLRALENTAPGQCNEGFLRSHANLVVIIVSDEEEASDRPIEEIVDALGQYKPFHQIRVATVVGSIEGEPSNCNITTGTACGSVCDTMLPQGSLQPCTRDELCPAGEACINDACNNPALRYWSSCFSCSFYDAPDCCSAIAGSRYVEFARAVEQRVHAARSEFPIADCQSLGTRAACLTDTICQASFGDTMARIARELILVDL